MGGDGGADLEGIDEVRNEIWTERGLVRCIVELLAELETCPENVVAPSS